MVSGVSRPSVLGFLPFVLCINEKWWFYIFVTEFAEMNIGRSALSGQDRQSLQEELC